MYESLPVPLELPRLRNDAKEDQQYHDIIKNAYLQVPVKEKIVKEGDIKTKAHEDKKTELGTGEEGNQDTKGRQHAEKTYAGY